MVARFLVHAPSRGHRNLVLPNEPSSDRKHGHHHSDLNPPAVVEFGIAQGNGCPLPGACAIPRPSKPRPTQRTQSHFRTLWTAPAPHPGPLQTFLFSNPRSSAFISG